MVSLPELYLSVGDEIKLIMWEFSELRQALDGTPLEAMVEPLSRLSRAAILDYQHGDCARWEAAIRALPAIQVASVRLNAETVSVSAVQEPDREPRDQLYRSMQALHPWRKGPFDLFGMVIDAEWRSCLKWSRVFPHLSSLEGRLILDVGSGNGYYLYRMLGAGASLAIGVDPTQLFLLQFRALNHYLGQTQVMVLPLKCEDLNKTKTGVEITGFDTVFSMGVYYHRRDPTAHLRQLAGFLRPGGELVLETLVIEHKHETMIRPERRYARMRNVWLVPSIPLVVSQLRSAGFTSVRVVDVTPTTCSEQRKTDWMTFESLSDCLDPDDSTRTVEGYPAPVRACMIATRRFTSS